MKEAHKRNRNHRHKKKCWVTNWAAYDRSLRNRGDITVENTFYRYKTIIGKRLRAGCEAARQVDATIGCRSLIGCFALGGTASVAVV